MHLNKKIIEVELEEISFDIPVLDDNNVTDKAITEILAKLNDHEVKLSLKELMEYSSTLEEHEYFDEAIHCLHIAKFKLDQKDRKVFAQEELKNKHAQIDQMISALEKAKAALVIRGLEKERDEIYKKTFDQIASDPDLQGEDNLQARDQYLKINFGSAIKINEEIIKKGTLLDQVNASLWAGDRCNDVHGSVSKDDRDYIGAAIKYYNKAVVLLKSYYSGIGTEAQQAIRKKMVSIRHHLAIIFYNKYLDEQNDIGAKQKYLKNALFHLDQISADTPPDTRRLYLQALLANCDKRPGNALEHLLNMFSLAVQNNEPLDDEQKKKKIFINILEQQGENIENFVFYARGYQKLFPDDKTITKFTQLKNPL
jgi:hypothetical protein